jgi:hypothetical protein
MLPESNRVLTAIDATVRLACGHVSMSRRRATKCEGSCTVLRMTYSRRSRFVRRIVMRIVPMRKPSGRAHRLNPTTAAGDYNRGDR